MYVEGGKGVNESRNKLLILGEPACSRKSGRGANGRAIGQKSLFSEGFHDLI
jgi:hypothetical protein